MEYFLRARVFGLLLSLTPVLGAQQAPHPAQVLGASPYLEALNTAYINRLNRERHRANPGAPLAHFDNSLLTSTVAHNQRMERLDSLFHDNTRYAEMAGSLLDDDPKAPVRLAQLIFARLYASPRHCEIQMDADLTGICVSASRGYYVVRLSYAPTVDEHPRTRRLKSSN